MRWASIPWTDGLYEVSDTGRVRRMRAEGPTEIRTRLSVNSKRPTCYISVKGKKKDAMVAELVAEAFKGPTPPGMLVYEIDGDRQNLNPDNLGYIPISSEAAKKVGRKKIRPVRAIDGNGKVIGRWRSAGAASEETLISNNAILRCCKGEKMRWMYAERFEFDDEVAADGS